MIKANDSLQFLFLFAGAIIVAIAHGHHRNHPKLIGDAQDLLHGILLKRTDNTGIQSLLCRLQQGEAGSQRHIHYIAVLTAWH